ncbi:MAG: HPr family phosphocarrier protein, partial [Planctomycetaceae bacterium]
MSIGTCSASSSARAKPKKRLSILSRKPTNSADRRRLFPDNRPPPSNIYCVGKRKLATVLHEVKIVNKYGLHARPAMQFVELANRYGSKIEVSNGTLTVDAKSIMSVMRLAATKGTTLRLTA